MNYQHRITFLRNHLQPKQAILFSDPTNIFYITGFKSLVNSNKEAYVYLNHKEVLLFHSSFTPLPKTNHFTCVKGPFISTIVNYIRNNESISDKSILINEKSLTVNENNQLQKKLSVVIQPLPDNLLWDLRTIKGATEQKIIEKAGKISRKAFEFIVDKIKEQMTEKELSDLLEYQLKKLGAEGVAFPTIVAFGSNGALPHHQPSEKRLEKNSAILIDFGAKVDGYCSDMTRSFWFGDKPTEEYIKVKKIVDDAYEEGLKFIKDKVLGTNKPPLTALAIDYQVRSFISKNNYSRYYIHTSGHGLGLNIHEPPSISWKNDREIKTGMTITLEPGIYLPNKFGYRYENTLIFQKDQVVEATKKC